MSDSARDAILRRVADATEGVRDAEPAGAWAQLPRRYRRTGSLDAAARAQRFAERLGDYGVRVRRTSEEELAAALATALRAHGARRVVVPDGFPEAWLATAALTARVGEDAPWDALDDADAVVSTCAVAIAETGTIVLDGGPGQGRRAATLVPDLHVCVVRASQVVELVPEAVARTAPAVEAGRPLTWISGPSATSDIELVRVGGVHGPRTLDVLWVAEAGS